MGTEQAEINHYDILGVSPTATADAIKTAYRARMNQYHPDRNRWTRANAVAALINEAWEVLGDPERRSVYDARMGFNSRKESHKESEARERTSDASGSETPPPPADPPPPPPQEPAQPESEPSRSAEPPEPPRRTFALMSLGWKLYILAWAWFGVIGGLSSDRNGPVVAFTIWLFGGSVAWLLASVLRWRGWRRFAKVMVCFLGLAAAILVLARWGQSDSPWSYLLAVVIICVVLPAFVLFINNPKDQQRPAPSPDTCPGCGTASAWAKRRDGSEGCWRCGKSRSVNDPPRSPAVSTEHRSAYVLATILIAGVFASPILASGDVARFGGVWLGSLMFPFLIALFLSRRRHDRAGFGRVFFWTALIMCSLAFIGTVTKTPRAARQHNSDRVPLDADQLTATPGWFEANAPVPQQGPATTQHQATDALTNIDRSGKANTRKQSSDAEPVGPARPAEPPQSMSQRLDAKCAEDAGRTLKRIRGDKPEEISTNYSPKYQRCYLLRLHSNGVDDSKTAIAEFWDVSDGSVIAKAALTYVRGTPGSVTGPGTLMSCQVENEEESTGSCIRLKEFIADHMGK
jgi:hypothetical protein